MLCTAAGTAGARRRDKAGDAVQLAAAIHRQQVAGKLPPQHGVDRAAQVSVTGGHILLLAVAQKAEADFRVRQRRMQHGFGHERALARVLFEEFHAGGGVVKQVVDRDRRAYRARAGLDALRLAALDTITAGVLVGLGLCQHLDLGNAGNGRQRFAAEA